MRRVVAWLEGRGEFADRDGVIVYWKCSSLETDKSRLSRVAGGGRFGDS